MNETTTFSDFIERNGAILLVWAKTVGYFVGMILFDKLSIPQDQFTSLGVLMIIDVITGYFKIKKEDPRNFRSRDLGDGIVGKMLVALLVISLAIAAQNGIHIDPKHFLEWSLGGLIVAEIYSIVQNVYIYKTGKMVEEYDAMSFLLKALREFLLRLLKFIVKKLNSLL